jgi:exosome complex RNA-binding protein Rrp4
MAEEYRSICKDCNVEFGYSGASILAGATRGLTRPERCPACRRTHSRESRSIGIPQIQIKPIGRRKRDQDLNPGRLGKIRHPKREHVKVQVESKFGKPDSLIDFGITDDDMCQLFETMQNYQVVVVVGPTGSGKSTFLPYRLMVPPEGRDIPPDIFTRFGQIAITQPRTQATRSIARFVSQDLHGSSLGAGFDVGFRHRGSPASDWRNKLVYLTDGTLINWIVSGQLANLSVIMIDEAHERSINIDLILGLLKQQLPRYPHLKLIIASATINAELFQGHFGGFDKVALLEFRGLKQYKVDAYFPPGDIKLYNNRYVPQTMAKRICNILEAIKDGEKAEGDILGFLPGEAEINTCADSLRSSIAEDSKLRELNINVYPLYTRLPQEEQDLALAQKANVIRAKMLRKIQECIPGQNQFIVLMLDQKSASEAYSQLNEALETTQIANWNLTLLPEEEQDFSILTNHVVFTSHAHYADLPDNYKTDYRVVTDRRVVIATNVAETSLTVDGIVYVVDSGLVKQSSWDPNNSANDLRVIFHSRAGCQQRWGRAGRVRDGEAHMLYTDGQFEDEEVFPAHTVPEIKRSSLEQVVLKAKAAGIDNIQKFPWIERPPERELQRAPEVLSSMGALDRDGDLTGFGMELQSFMTDVPIANLLVAADQYACGVEMATLAALSPMRLQGGLLNWDRWWDFPTKEAISRVHKQLALPCNDDLDFFLKLYSIWAEAGNSTLRSTLCNLFFISETTIDERVVPARQQFLEMLSIGKKGDEDRLISFSTLDRLRIVLAVSLPEHFIFTHQDDKIQDLSENGVELPINIDENSVLAENLPSHFISLQRRIFIKDDTKNFSLSCLIKIDESWLELRKLSVLQQACRISQLLKPLRNENTAAKIRNRLFLDVNYPAGAHFAVTKTNDNELRPGELISLPLPIPPVFVEDKIEEVSFVAPDGNKDVTPLAGWEDKEDKQIAYGPPDENDAESILSEDPANDILFSTFDKLSAKHVFSEFEFENANADDTSTGCIVADYDFKVPKVIFRQIQKNAEEAGFAPDQVIKVQGIELLGKDDQEKALLVKTVDSPVRQSIIDAKDLSFSGRWFIAELYLNKEFKVKTVERQGVVRLSRLPCIEESIHRYVDEKIGRHRNVPVEIPCRLLEKRGINLNFLLIDLENKGIYETAYLKLPRNWKDWGMKFDIGKTYEFFLDGKIGHSDEKMPSPPKNLIDFVETCKKKQKIFWNNRQACLHTKLPMKSILRESLEKLCTEARFQRMIARLYIFSNRLKLWKYKPGNILATGHKAVEESFLNELVPNYEHGDIVHGRISAIFEESVLVVLQKGGKGRIDLDHLSWKGTSLADPREIVSADQQIECTVLRQYVKPDAKGKDRVIIDLTILDRNEFPVKYLAGSFHDVKVFMVNKLKNFALSELQPGIVGIIFDNTLKEGQTFNARIKSYKINPLAIRPLKPVRIQLERYHKIEINKADVPRIIGPEGSVIQEIQKQTKCRISIEKHEGKALITSAKKENIDNAIAEIDKIIQKHTARKPKQHKAKIVIPSTKLGRLIGKNQTTINSIKNQADCSIWYRQDGSVEIKSWKTQDNIEKCIQMIEKIIPETKRV